MPAFTAIATKVHKDPVTTTYLNSLKQNDDYLITGVAKAWVVFDGSAADISASIRASQNIASLGDLGVGQYRVTMTTGMANTGYVPLINLAPNGSVGTVINVDPAATFTTSAFSTVGSDVNNTSREGIIYIAIFGQSNP